MSRFSPFSSVDASDDPAALVAYLDLTAHSLAAMKRYMAAAAGRAVPGGLVVDVGCGAGHDLALLGAAGLRPVGVDPSTTMLDVARGAAPDAPLVRAGGERLPFRSASVDGCRIERVLQHVANPDRVIAEVARVLRPGGVLALFDADWSALAFGRGAAPRQTAAPADAGDRARDRSGDGVGRLGPPVDDEARAAAAGDAADDETVARALVTVRSPDVGERLVALTEAHGLRVEDRVTELSFGYAVADHPLRLEAALARAVERGRLDAAVAARWWARQRQLDATGGFRASWAKVLVVAHRR